MAIRRARQRKQVIDKLTAIAPPGETFIACMHVESGPSPWINLICEVPFVGDIIDIIIIFMRKYYFLTLTNSSVVVNKASRWTNRPQEVVLAFPRNATPISNIKRVRLWSSLYLQMAQDTSATRLNVHRIWRNDLDQFIAAFPYALAPGSGAPQQQPGAGAPQGMPPAGAPQLPQQRQPLPPQGAPAPQQQPSFTKQPPAQAQQQPGDPQAAQPPAAGGYPPAGQPPQPGQNPYQR